jgi:hypothetical protein
MAEELSVREISPLIFSLTTRLGRAMVVAEGVDAQVFVLPVISDSRYTR